MDLLADKNIECNYLYDEYINNPKLMNGLKGAFSLDLCKSLELIKFFEYLPTDVESTEKKATKEELLAIKRDALVANAIREKLRGNEYDEEFYDYAAKTDTLKLIKYKFKSFSFKDKCNYFNSLSDDRKLDLINEYEAKYDINTEGLALLYYMKNKQSSKVKKISRK